MENSIRFFGLIFAAGALGLACASNPPAGTTVAATASSPPRAPNVNGQLELVGPIPRGASIALSAFVVESPANDSGGECISSSPFGPNSKVIIANFPTRAASTMNSVLTFDSVGRLVRYNETRGVTGVHGMPASATIAQRDSARAIQQATIRSTSISLDYTIGLATLRNFGGGKTSVIATAPVSVVEKMPQFGPINERIERVRKLCGV